MTSIPRDYYVKLANCGKKDKLTHSALYGGTDNSVKTIEDFLDIDIDFYARVDFQSVIQLVDALGGIDIYSDKAFIPYTDHGIKIPEGNVHMNGRMALAFARERYTYKSGDQHRTENQQAVCSAMKFRACTGFDGGFEVGEAIRRLRGCVPTWKLNINANNNRVALAA